jgi:hypothetical protein
MDRRQAAFTVTLALATALAGSAGAADRAERVVSPAERTSLSLTLYQDDTALVRDRRAVTLDKGATTLVWEGVSREAHTASGLLSAPNLSVQVQGFDTAGASGERLLSGSVGKNVVVVWRDAAGSEREQRARVLAAQGTPLFDVEGKVVAGQPARIVYDSLPAGLRTVPVFNADITAQTAGKRQVELSYMTGGLGWQADYVAELMPGGTNIMLSAWTTLTNASGIDYPNARVSVVAGRPSQGGSPPRQPLTALVTANAKTLDSLPAADLGPYHLFTLPQRVSLRDGERTQAMLLAPSLVKVKRELVLGPLPAAAWRGTFGAGPPQNPMAMLQLENTVGAGLGRPLPSGTLRLYQRGADGALVFLGQDLLTATPDHGTARIAIGQAFDVTARRVQTDFQRVSADVSEAAWEVHLSNAGDSPAVLVVHEVFGGDWLVVDESQPHRRDDAFGASWTTTVPAKGQSLLRYRVRVRG